MSPLMSWITVIVFCASGTYLVVQGALHLARKEFDGDEA